MRVIRFVWPPEIMLYSSIIGEDIHPLAVSIFPPSPPLYLKAVLTRLVTF